MTEQLNALLFSRRKFVAFLLVFGATFTGLLLGKVTDGTFQQITIFTFGIFAGANVGEHFASRGE